MTPFPDQRSLWRSDGSLKQFSVYIMSNNSMTLYTGMTSELRNRAAAHKNGEGCEFTTQYHFDRLVYFETYGTASEAIAREKQIKGWTRAKKIALVKTTNPSWRDLADGL
jgi:putative endonuclease